MTTTRVVCSDSEWVNSDIPRMAAELESQAASVGPMTSAAAERVRLLTDAAIHLRMAYAALQQLPVARHETPPAPPASFVLVLGERVRLTTCVTCGRPVVGEGNRCWACVEIDTGIGPQRRFSKAVAAKERQLAKAMKSKKGTK